MKKKTLITDNPYINDDNFDEALRRNVVSSSAIEGINCDDLPITIHCSCGGSRDVDYGTYLMLKRSFGISRLCDKCVRELK